MIESMREYKAENDTLNGYYDQFKNTPSEINVGDHFVVLPKTWQESIYEVILYRRHGCFMC